jgi:hypothetical protein
MSVDDAYQAARIIAINILATLKGQIASTIAPSLIKEESGDLSGIPQIDVHEETLIALFPPGCSYAQWSLEASTRSSASRRSLALLRVWRALASSLLSSTAPVISLSR